MVLEQIEKMSNDISLNQKHMKQLIRELKKINHLLIFKETIEELKKEQIEMDEYLVLYAPVFQQLVHIYRNKESIYKAFLASFLSQHYPFRLSSNSVIDAEIMEYIEDKSIYCRENAMLYFYQKGSTTFVLNALLKMSDQHLYYNKKLLSNDLLKFQGDQRELANKLLQAFDRFNPEFQVSIINYLRFSSYNFKQKCLDMLMSHKYDKEVEFALIRYFGKNKDEKILPYLLNILKNDQSEIEYKIITAQIIQNYDEQKVRDALIHCVSDSNWYVRKNAATSLSHMNLSKKDFDKIMRLEDRYGKEMIQYTFATNRKHGKEDE